MPPRNANEEAVLQCAARAAQRYFITAGAFRRSVTSIEHSLEHYERALHEVERRTVVRKVVPGSSSRSRTSGSLPNPAMVDPWTVDVSRIEQDTRVLAECPSCVGTKKVNCSACGGSTRVRCGYCGGGGRVSGQRGSKNCPDCRGRGDKKCTLCRSGKIDCSVCDATGRVEAWLTVERQTLRRVCVQSKSPASEVCRWPPRSAAL